MLGFQGQASAGGVSVSVRPSGDGVTIDAQTNLRRVIQLQITVDGVNVSTCGAGSTSCTYYLPTSTIGAGNHTAQASVVYGGRRQFTTTSPPVAFNLTDNSGSSSGSGSTPPVPSSGQYVTDHALRNSPSITRPPYLVPFTDPVFGSTITRITDPTMVPDAPPPNQRLGLRHEYSRIPALNADRTLMGVIQLGGTGRGSFQVRRVLDGALLASFVPSGGDITGNWHKTDPNRLIFVQDNAVKIYHADSKLVETVIEFPQYQFVNTGEKGQPSDDWHYWAGMGFKQVNGATDWQHPDLLVADLTTKTIVGFRSNAAIGGDRPENIGMSPSGQWVITQWTGSPPFREDTFISNRDFSGERVLTPGYGHSDYAIDSNGDELFVMTAESTRALWPYLTGVYGVDYFGEPYAPVESGSAIIAARLRDSQRRIVMNVPWTWGWGMHANGNGSRTQRGWILISTDMDVGQPQAPFGREIFWLKLDGSESVKRIAHHHSDIAYDSTREKDYFAESQVVSSWDATTVTFASVWGENFQRYDAYNVTGKWWP